jgi:sugar-specific transcriptional regulator TrmB
MGSVARSGSAGVLSRPHEARSEIVAQGVGIEERLVEAMRQHGFTATDAKTYLALLKVHPATGYDLAARSGVPRSAIYNVLRRLESLGLVNAVQDKPAKYLPLPPERLIELVETRFSRHVEELRTALAGLSSSAVEPATWTIQGYTRLLEQARGLIASSRESVYLSVWQREAHRLASPLQGAAREGRDVVLFSFNPLGPLPGRIFSYDIAEPDLERYWGHKVILVADHRRALVGTADETDDNRAVLTEERALVEMALSNLVLDITLYGQRTGTETADVVSRLTAHLAPVEELVASRKTAP